MPNQPHSLSLGPAPRRIDYQRELNPAQYQAVTVTEGPVLVIAGAGSGKTRTLVSISFPSSAWESGEDC